MRLLPRSVPGRMRMVAVAVLVVAALACIPNLVRAEMGSVLDHPCAGPGCEQQIACGRTYQAIAPTRPGTGPTTLQVPAPSNAGPPGGPMRRAPPSLVTVGSRSIAAPHP